MAGPETENDQESQDADSSMLDRLGEIITERMEQAPITIETAQSIQNFIINSFNNMPGGRPVSGRPFVPQIISPLDNIVPMGGLEGGLFIQHDFAAPVATPFFAPSRGHMGGSGPAPIPSGGKPGLEDRPSLTSFSLGSPGKSDKSSDTFLDEQFSKPISDLDPFSFFTSIMSASPFFAEFNNPSAEISGRSGNGGGLFGGLGSFLAGAGTGLGASGGSDADVGFNLGFDLSADDLDVDIFSFARGGSFVVGGVGGVDSQLARFFVSPGERITIDPPPFDEVAPQIDELTAKLDTALVAVAKLNRRVAALEAENQALRQAIVDINKSIEPRAISAVQDARRRGPQLMRF